MQLLYKKSFTGQELFQCTFECNWGGKGFIFCTRPVLECKTRMMFVFKLKLIPLDNLQKLSVLIYRNFSGADKTSKGFSFSESFQTINMIWNRGLGTVLLLFLYLNLLIATYYERGRCVVPVRKEGSSGRQQKREENESSVKEGHGPN